MRSSNLANPPPNEKVNKQLCILLLHVSTSLSSTFERAQCVTAEHLRSLARELVKLGPRQLQAVSPVLETDAELVEAISTAKGITPTNQACV